jgi:hypothetical protein
MEINYVALFIAAVAAMALAFVWYGPLFGKKWLEIAGVSAEEMAQRRKMQQTAMPLYAIQFALMLLQVYILWHFIKGWGGGTGIEIAVWIWLGFIMPTVAATAMWNNESRNRKLGRFMLQAGYQLVAFILFGFILGMA